MPELHTNLHGRWFGMPPVVGPAAHTPVVAVATSARPTPFVGRESLIPAIGKVIDEARSRIDVSSFRINGPLTVPKLGVAHEHGVKVHAIIDADQADPTQRANLASWAKVTDYGTDPWKQHGKAIAADNKVGMVATDVLGDADDRQVDAGIRLQGSTASSLQHLLEIQSGSARPEARRAVADAVRGQGILVNDPRINVHYLSDGIRSLLSNASQTLTVITKDFDDPRCLQMLADAAQRGVTTRLLTWNATDEDISRLRSAGVQASIGPTDRKFHGLLITADNQALLGSSYLAERVLDGSAGRKSRELGVVVDGATAQTLLTSTLDALHS